MYKNEGPLGESLLPSPSVGYSQIKIKNIHRGFTSTGYEVYEFYTCKDFPFLVNYTTVNRQHDGFPVSIGGSIPLGVVNIGGGYKKTIPHLSQGYTFIMNEMHGQPKRTRKYAEGTIEPIAEETYEYFPLGTAVNVMGNDMVITQKVLGKELEMLYESRQVSDIVDAGSGGVDVSAALMIVPCTPPLVIPGVYLKSISFGANVTETTLRTHVTTKIIKYPVIVKKVINKSDGITHVTENMVFDQNTGNPVVVKSYDDFDQNVINQDFMADWMYKEMRSKALNEGITITSNFVAAAPSNSYLDFSASGNCADMDKLTRGDFVKISLSGAGAYLYNVDVFDYILKRVYLQKSALHSGASEASTAGVSIKVIHSGYTSQMNVKAGNITMNNESAPFVKTVPPLSAGITQLVNALNGLYASGSTSPITALASGVKIVHPSTGKCGSLPDNIYVTKSTSSVSIDLGKDYSVTTPTIVYCNTPISGGNPHPMVTDLNNYLNFYWGSPITGTAGRTTSSIPNPFPDVTSYIYDRNTHYSLTAGGLKNQYNCVNNEDNVLTTRYLSSTPLSSTFRFYGYQLGAGLQTSLATVFVNPGTSSPAGSGSVYTTIIPPQNTATNVRTAATIPSEKGFIRTLNSTSTCDEYVPYASKVPLANLLDPARGLTDYTDYIGKFDQDSEGWLIYQKFATIDNQVTCVESKRVFGVRFYKIQNITTNYTKLCGSTLTIKSGIGTAPFSYDPKSGYIMFGPAGCALPVNCLRLCDDNSSSKKVVSASAALFKDDWNYSGYTTVALKYPLLVSPGFTAPLNDYEAGRKGKWRPFEQYTYREKITGYDEVTKKNFNSGIFDLALFNWEKPSLNDPTKWVKVSTTDKYDPNGQPLEDHNILNIYSTAKYGYNNTLPVCVAQNARFNSVVYEGFENVYKVGTKDYFEEGLEYDKNNKGILSTAVSHTGAYSMRLNSGTSGVVIGTIQPSVESAEGVIVRAWFYTKGDKNALKDKLKLSHKYYIAPYTETTMQYISSAGEWQLYEAKIPAGVIQSVFNYQFKIHLDPSYTGEVYMDDARVQSIQAEMVCYVYDKAQRLTAVLDDQHYASIYEYNSEGVLVRKLKETREGIKTISETQYNTKGKAR